MSPIELMNIAMMEARNGGRSVRPNPLVGAALVSRDGKVVSAFHARYGEAHAERVLFEKCKTQNVDTKGATLAVTLEPCSHFGKTPPCVDAVIEAKIAKVIIPFADPNPLVASKGIRKLKEAGIEVVSGIEVSAAFDLNKEWLWAQKLKRPFVTLKYACSKNSVWKSPEKTWITTLESRLDAMTLRGRVDAILTSGATLREDNPQMNLRDQNAAELVEHQPDLYVLSKDKTLNLQKYKASQVSKRNIYLVSQPSLESLLAELFKKGVRDLMIEAGPTLSRSFFESSLVDEVWKYQSNEILEGPVESMDSYLEKFQIIKSHLIGVDQFTFYTQRNLGHYINYNEE